MIKKNAAVKKHPVEARRRLSLWRVMIAIVLLIGVSAGGWFGWQRWQAYQADASSRPWFAGYVDVTATPTFAFEQIGATSNKDAVLSFIVSSQSDNCTPAWGGSYTLDQAQSSLDLDRRIARLQQQGGNVAVSFGGLINNELAVKCSDAASLVKAYSSVVERYDTTMIDLDLEGAGLTNKDAGARRATAIAKLQSERRAAGKKLAVWVTLPVTPQGLSEDGTNAVAQLLSKGVDIAGINAMTMDYGQSLDGKPMLEATENALTQTQRQLAILYRKAGVKLSDRALWFKIGATPMIGQNDTLDEVFTLDDAKGLNAFARSHGVGRLSMWSVNRDITCGSNYIDIRRVSSSCSGIKQDGKSFAALLGANLNGSFSLTAGNVTENDTSVDTQKDDNPATSPYQIWSDSGAYLEGTKVVWHHNVYKAKWWTQSDVPDSPVLQSWQTPWELVGPVLPGEKPVLQATLPKGTYAEWSGDVSYDTGTRILFKGVPYQAKWWNRGESPAAASSNADGSPWVPLTQAQIDAMNKTNK
jgi:chitinase